MDLLSDTLHRWELLLVSRILQRMLMWEDSTPVFSSNSMQIGGIQSISIHRQIQVQQSDRPFDQHDHRLRVVFFFFFFFFWSPVAELTGALRTGHFFRCSRSNASFSRRYNAMVARASSTDE